MSLAVADCALDFTDPSANLITYFIAPVSSESLRTDATPFAVFSILKSNILLAPLVDVIILPATLVSEMGLTSNFQLVIDIFLQLTCEGVMVIPYF